MSKNKGKVAVAMSGGVDSSTAALLLKNDGYEVIGVTASLKSDAGKCCQPFEEDAKQVCDFLEIPHVVADFRNEFNSTIIDYFLNTYKMGKTPNPCVLCNRKIKWGLLYQYCIKELACDYFATGHYALIEQHNNKYIIKRPKDKSKDQTYVMVYLTQEVLSKTIFPNAYFDKTEIKKIAGENNLPTANKPESQDVCFIDNTERTQDYLESRLGINPGNIVDCSNGQIIGEHKGIYRYTIGQRKGIKVAYPYPLYVVSIDTETNTIYVGSKEDIQSSNLIVSSLNWVSGETQTKKFYALTKIRYNTSAKLAQIEPIDEYSANVAFEEPVYAITPGQVAAFYSLDNQVLLGGGWIQ